MIFDKYRHLGEDAQRLLCYFVEIGIGTGKRMSEHAYMLRQYCFPTFDGMKAEEELVREGIFRHEGRDWLNGAERIGVSQYDFVPALWYLYEERKDILLALQKCRQTQNAEYMFIRYAVKQLVDSGYQVCSSANVIKKEQVDLLCPMVQEPRFDALFKQLESETFTYFFDHVADLLVEHDIATDTSLMHRVIDGNRTITEVTRRRLTAKVELYDYIANGKLPSEGVYTDVAAGAILGAIRHLCNGNACEAVKWFDLALRVQGGGQADNDVLCSVIPCLYLIIAYIAVASNDAKGNEGIVAECRKRLYDFMRTTTISQQRQMMPAKILAEDFCKTNKELQKRQIRTLYADMAEGNDLCIYRKIAFLLANYLGYSTADMEVSQCMPNLALLRHEMAKYLPFGDEERLQLSSLYGDQPPLTAIYHKAEWESVLEDLLNGATDSKDATQQEQTTRLMYIRLSETSRDIQVREQTRLKNGNWSNGKLVNDARYRRGELECMNDADRRILARLNHSEHWELLLEDVIEEMIDDDRLYIGSAPPYKLVKVDRDKPYLMVENEGGRFVVKSNVPADSVMSDIVISEDSPTHYSVITIPADIRDYYVKLLQLGTLPLEAEDTLRSLLATIGGKVELHSSLIEGGSTLPMVDGQWNVGFRLSPKNNGNWEVEAFVRPLLGGRRTYRLGEGDTIIIDENEEGRVRVKRNMEMERSNAAIVQAFWESEGYDYGERERNDTYPPEFMLSLVQMIQSHPDMFYAEWQEGSNVRVRSLTRGQNSWSGRLTQRGQWFDIEGEVEIDDNTRISISQLLELVGKSNGKYIRLEDGEYLTLSEKLRKQLKALDAIANRERGKIRISPFSAALIGDDILNGDIELSLDEPLTAMRQRIIDCSEYTPDVPAELNATLRPYQVDGYLWMARLNSWGAGALLADDMGLGKTIQTIAFLLLKKNEGASLVVAPASVAPNWKTEMERFAPTLNVQILNFSTNRHKTIKEAKAGDVIVTTYGILLSIQEYITQKDWNVVCLDEAHIIKNRGAKTSAAAMKIQAKNRVMLTGTPVQNHLGELWNLFQFVNPGLLGGYEHFSQKFIVPIEGYQDKEKQEQLERIVHPFMLRRTKQAVLKELPDKTEIYHSVELNKDELAIYESIRARAEQMIRENGTDVDMHVLAEITRLRQAACSVQLIEPKWTGECSKITSLVELLQGVTEGGNRALVFSQFVSLLDIVRRELDRLNMEYFYIDGSVPLKQRTEMVDAFQRGENKLFLISLKAGGLGLNLTGANYVFHLDPWWNPAIEQQATDRAYRIGQHQAVTVYHLVSKNTIEEKIIRLHQTKRDLAENILANTDMSYKITGEELLNMVAR
ncbi:MAG: ATP-dependent helicase [Prevotellaceae bacterium]|nr:ATP-dependent helicase [Prevotellaceae bacterium]